MVFVQRRDVLHLSSFYLHSFLLSFSCLSPSFCRLLVCYGMVWNDEVWEKAIEWMNKKWMIFKSIKKDGKFENQSFKLFNMPMSWVEWVQRSIPLRLQSCVRYTTVDYWPLVRYSLCFDRPSSTASRVTVSQGSTIPPWCINIGRSDSQIISMLSMWTLTLIYTAS